MLANLVLQPRLLIPVFIGSRLQSFAEDPESSSHDPLRFWLNIASLGIALTLSTVTGVWIYRLTLEQMRKIEASEHLGIDEAALGEALLGEYGDEGDEGEIEAQELTRGRGLDVERGELVRRTSGSGSD